MKIVYFAPPGFDYSSSQITEGLWLLKKCSSRVSEFICTDKMVHHGASIEDLPISNRNFARANVHDADIILFSSGGDMSPIVDDLTFVINSPKLAKKVVFIDGHDSNAYLVDPSKIALYLKRELRYPEVNNLAWPNVLGFTFGVYDFHFRYNSGWFDERDIDIAFLAFGGSSPIRKQCQDVLLDYQKNNPSKIIVASAPNDKQPYSIDEYRSIMRRTKIAINVPGAGIDTLRFWEAMGFGAALVTYNIQNLLYVRNAPEPRRHAMYFDSWPQMLGACEALLNNKNWWTTMRIECDKHIAQYHSTMARANQLIDLFKMITD